MTATHLTFVPCAPTISLALVLPVSYPANVGKALFTIVNRAFLFPAGPRPGAKEFFEKTISPAVSGFQRGRKPASKGNTSRTVLKHPCKMKYMPHT